MRIGMPLSLLAGIAATGLYLAFTLFAYVRYPAPYSPTANWLSDLGNPLVNPRGAILYNLGCILTGTVLVVFHLGLSRWNTGDRRMRVLLGIGQAAGIASALFLILAATFPLGTHSNLHSVFSKMVSVFLGFFLTFSATVLLKNDVSIKWLAAAAFVSAAVNFVYGAFLYEVFLAEWLAIGLFMVYVLLISWNSGRLVDGARPV